VDRINRDNVENLVPAWSYSFGGEQQPGQASQPLVHDGTLPGAPTGRVSDLYLDMQSEPEFIPIDKQPDDGVMHLNRFGTTDRLTS
jgi:alcohol dehydrogenase (cytochrome c)